MNQDNVIAILLKNNHLSKENLQKALQRQLIIGGSLDTNLLEMSLCEEATLVDVLSEAYAMVSAKEVDLSQIDPHLTTIFPQVLAETYHLIPFYLEEKTLHVLSHLAVEKHLKEQLQKHLDLHLEIYAWSEIRMQAAMHLLYGVGLTPRYRKLLQHSDVPASFRLNITTSTPNTTDASTTSETPNQLSTQSPGQPSMLSWGISSQRIQPLKNKINTLSRSEFKKVLHALSQAKNRDRIVELLLSFTLSIADYGALFFIHGVDVHGWRSIDKQNTERLHQIDIPLSMPSVFQTVYATGGHYLGPLASNQTHRFLFETLKRPFPKVALVAPISIALKTRIIFYVDNAQNSISSQRASALLMLLQRCGLIFEQLIRSKKQVLEQHHAIALPTTDDKKASKNQEKSHAGSNLLLNKPLPMTPALQKFLQQASLASAFSTVTQTLQTDKYEALPKAEALPEEIQAIDHQEVLLKALEASEEHVRQSALLQLLKDPQQHNDFMQRHFPGKLAFEPLEIERLPDFAACSGVCAWFAARGAHVASLVEKHLQHHNATVRFMAIYYFKSVHSPHMCVALAQRLYDANPKIRQLVIETLSQYKHDIAYKQLIQGLCEQLKHPQTDSQIMVIHILAELREQSSIPDLIQMLIAPEIRVAQAAAAALTRITGHAFGHQLGLWSHWWMQAQNGSRAQWLLQGLRNPEPSVRKIAHTELENLTGHKVTYEPQAPENVQEQIFRAWQALLTHINLQDLS